MADALPRAPRALPSQENLRLALERERRAAIPEPPAPVDMDPGSLNVPFLGDRTRRLANEGRVNLQGARPIPERQAETPGGSAAVDQAIGRESRDRRLQSGMDRARSAKRQEAGSQPSQGGASIGRMAGLAAGASGGAGAALSSAAAGGGVNTDAMKQQLGTALIKACWSFLWPSFGHSIYIIDLLFILGFGSRYCRQYIPEVGHEWMPEQVRRTLPKTTLLPIKYGEMTALFLITGFIAAIDILLLTLCVFLISILMAVAQGLTGG